MATQTRLVTAEELLELPSDFRCELIDGVVIELSPPSGLHGRVAGKAALILGRAEAGGLGIVIGEVGFVVRHDPDTVRAPDVGFLRKEHVPVSGLGRGYLQGAPDVVVEVVSPWDTAAEIQVKVREWIEGGAGIVLVVYPETRTVHVLRSLQNRQTLSSEESIDLADVLPGFSFSVGDLFD